MYPDIKTLAKILVDESYISEDDAKQALEAARSAGDFIDFLIRQELLTKALLGQALAEYYEVPFVDLSGLAIDKEEMATIPEELAREQRVVYLKSSDKLVGLATDQPQAVDVKKITPLFKGKTIRFYFALPEAIDESFMAYAQTLPTRFAEIIKKGVSVAPEIVDEIVKDALRYQASDIHFEPDLDDVVVRFRVDGNLREAGRIPTQFYANVLEFSNL